MSAVGHIVILLRYHVTLYGIVVHCTIHTISVTQLVLLDNFQDIVGSKVQRNFRNRGSDLQWQTGSDLQSRTVKNPGSANAS